MPAFTSTRTFQQKKKQAPNVETISLSYGKQPPHASDIEQVVLGAIMIAQGAYEESREYIKDRSDVFYQKKHQMIYTAMQSLNQDKQNIDMVMVADELARTKNLEAIGGLAYLAELTHRVATSAHLKSHCEVLLRAFIHREVIRMCGLLLEKAYDDEDEAEDLINIAEQEIYTLSDWFLRKNFEALKDAVFSTMERLEMLRKRADASAITGVYTGFPRLDDITSGWQKTDLIILAARPGVGKTAFALNLAIAAAQAKEPTPAVVFSLEMSTSQLVSRFLSMQSEIALQKITRAQLTDNDMEQLKEKGVEPLMHTPIYIDDTAALNLFELRAKCRRLVSQENVGLIIIDYLQLLVASDKFTNSREQQISKISRELKSLAKELSVPIIALSQLSRAVEQRGGGGHGNKDGGGQAAGKVPQLSDLRESGAIEQDADMVMFLYRPDYYGQEQDSEGENIKGYTLLKIAKHRNGSLDDVELKFEAPYQKFVPWSSMSMGGSFAPIDPSGMGGTMQAYPSKMNSSNYTSSLDADADEDAPF